MIQRMFVTIDTKKTNYKNVGKINHGDDLILELTVLTDGDMISFDDPMVDLLVKKSDGKMIRQNSGIEHIKPNKFVIEVGKDCVTSPGLTTNQLIINDNGRISTCIFYYTILNSLEEDIIQSISNVEVLEQLDEYVIEARERMELLNNDINKLEEFFGATSDTLVEAEMARNEAEQKRVQSEILRVNNENNRIEADNIRNQNDSIRNQNELDRSSSELVREQRESERILNEEERRQNESERMIDESTRQQNENIRQSNESIRMGNETDRKTQENRRATAETNRVNAETTRRNNENSRISNETERQKAMNEMKSLLEDARGFDERVGVIEDEIEEINSSLDNIMTKVNAGNLLLSRLGKKYVNMSDTYNSIQGMTYLENDICVCAYASDKPGNMVRLDKINIKSGNVIMSKEIALGHANDLCYDGEFIYVTMTKNYTTNTNAKIIFKLNPSNLTLVDTIQNPSTGLNSWGGVAYDNKTKQFFVTSFEERNQCEIYDQEFRYVKTINLKQETYNETGYQTLSAHNGKLYQITINPEVIFEFNVEGNLLKVYNIDEYQGIYKTGELQSLCFREDGRAYLRSVAKLSRLSNGIEQFWLTDLSSNVNNSNNRFSSCFGQRSDLTMVVDNTTEFYNSTGLTTAPFNSLEEMILSLHAPEFQDEQLTVDIKTNFKYSNLYIVGCNNLIIYCNNKEINSIRLIGCNNVNVYDYKIVGYMDASQISVLNSNVKLGGGNVTKANTEHTTLIERSTVIADGQSLGIFVENPVITLKKISTLTVIDRDNKVINGLSKDNTSKLKTVRLLKGDINKTNISLPTDLSNYANVELRYKFPRGSGTLKWVDLSVAPRCSSVYTNGDGITVYDCWFILSNNILTSEGATRGVKMTENGYIYESPELLFDIAIWD